MYINCDLLTFAKQATLKLSQMCPRNNYWVLLLLLCLSQIAVVSFFSSGFIPKQLYSLDSEDDEANLSSFLKGCPKDILVKKTLEKGTVSKMVIMVIDAWQERFFFGRKVMQFLHQLASNGQAVAFSGRLQIPTVTMPRIKAITAGVVPSFVDIVNNFASSSISIDNIIDRLNDKGYRCTFCGDDTWLRLFPNRFDNHSVGVMSFYVSDFKEIDDSVTVCMRARFTTTAIKTWDLMILHYVGFDHIGHYLGGTHSEINNKLVEMDSVIKELYEKLHEIYSTNFSLIILGDHGMTESGNHGGPSELETVVPIVYVDGRKRTTNRKVLGASVEQIDIVPTLATLFNVPIPKQNLGVTLFPYIAVDHSNLSVLISVLQNIEQFRKLGVSSSKLNQCISRSYDSLQKYCSNASQNIGGLIWDCVGELRKVQSGFLHIRTDINSVRLIVAIGLSIIVSCISICFMYFMYLHDIYDFRNRLLSTYLTIFTQLLHPVALFASSLIEEEHDVQYFFFASHLTVMLLEEFHGWLSSRNKRNSFNNPARFRKILTVLFLLIIHRLCRGYTESGRRRWIMERDISNSNKTYLMGHYEILTSIGSSSDMPDIVSLLKQRSILRFISCLLSLVLIGTGLILFYGKRTSHSRLAFFLILTALFGIFTSYHYKFQLIFLLVHLCNIFLLLLFRDLFLFLFLWALLIMRTYNVPLTILQLFLGYCLASADAKPILIVRAICSSFFYPGNSNSFSTIDVAVGLVGLGTYQPVPVFLQVVLNVYSGPLLIVFGWWHSLVEQSITLNSLSQKRNAVLFLICCTLQLNMSLSLLSVYIHRYHLFIWSVFAPKFLYESFHLIVFTAVSFLVYISNKPNISRYGIITNLFSVIVH